MIISKLQGGHSNQLFQYALGRALAKKLKTELILDLSWFDDFADVDTPRFYELDCYPLKATTRTSLEGMRIVDQRQPIGKRLKIMRKLGVGNVIHSCYEQGQGFNADILNTPDNTLMIGFWQTEKYFKNIREDLLKELEPTTRLSKNNQKLQKLIQDTESVSIHVRRGDYVTNKDANAFHGLMDLDYYRRALAHIKKQTGDKNLRAFVFSNDIAWCKKNLILDVPMTFVEGNDKGSDDMRLMKQCKHFIMANSSFSWWGAWLSTNPGKIIVAPKTWFKDTKTNGEIEIVPDSWVRL